MLAPVFPLCGGFIMRNINTEKTVSVIAGMTIGEGLAFFADLTHFIDTNLIDGIDFVTMENSKPGLLPSGAKKLLDYLNLFARLEDIVCTEISDILSYEVEVYLVDDYSGALRAKGKARCSSEEEEYKYGSRDMIYSKAKSRAITTGILQVACLYEKFVYQDDVPEDITNSAYRQSKTERPATVKQLNYLHDLIKRSNTDIRAVNQYVQRHYGVKDYRDVSISDASLLIQKFIKACK